jgi:hypothetical protein
VKEYYEVINIVYIHSEACYGSVESMGAFASTVKFTKNGHEYEELMENDEFSIIDEIVFTHVEESD